MLRRDKVLGMLIGGAIGDAWGAPVEMFSPEQIKQVHPAGVYKYLDPICHKFFKPGVLQAGMITDDTQLTVATMIGIMAGEGFDMDGIAESHVHSVQQGTLGFGRSTLEAILRISKGVHWSRAGRTDEPKRGVGNGICMKCSPLAAWYATKPQCPDFTQRMVKYAAMTHYTKLAAISGIIHVMGCHYCLVTDADEFDLEQFMRITCKDVFAWRKDVYNPHYYDVEYLEDTEDDLEYPMTILWDSRKDLGSWSDMKIRERFGKLGGYVYHSLPGSYAFFCRNPHSLDTGSAVIHAGGDTDTNAKMVLEMIGALHGLDFFLTDENRWTVDGLLDFSALLRLGNTFCDQFGIR